MKKRPELRFTSAGELARAATDAASTRPPTTRPFPQQWPNPVATDYTPYRNHARAPETPLARRGPSPVQIALAVAGVAVLAAVLIGALWLIIGQDSGTNVGQPFTDTTSVTTFERTTTTRTRTTSLSPTSSVPGTDAQGFISYPGARCDPGDEAATLARTAQSVLVVCRTAAGSYYYRGVRLRDGASIELPNAVRSSDGFDVTNLTDGTRYEIRRSGLTIVAPDGQTFFERMLDYASN